MDIFLILIGLTQEIWHTLNEASPYILLGIFTSGIIQIFVDKDKIVKYLGKPGFKSVLLATLCGIPLPLCSCGVLPTAISLRKNGASKGATLSFLISTPETSVDSIAISYGLLDPLMTIFRPLAAFITALLAGISENIFGGKDEELKSRQEKSCVFCEEGDKHSHSHGHRFIYGMRYAFIELLGDISKWLALGLIIAGVISYFIPQELVKVYLGEGWQAMVMMLVVGIPLYICATASTPIAAAFIAKGMSPGVALVFLLVGPATNIAGIITMSKFLGKKSIAIYLVSISICAVLLGSLLNQVYFILNINIKATLGRAGQMLPGYIKIISAIVLVGLMINSVRMLKKGHKS